MLLNGAAVYGDGRGSVDDDLVNSSDTRIAVSIPDVLLGCMLSDSLLEMSGDEALDVNTMFWSNCTLYKTPEKMKKYFYIKRTLLFKNSALELSLQRFLIFLFHDKSSMNIFFCMIALNTELI